MTLNIPDTRQTDLTKRLLNGQQLVAADIAAEFNVSLDTIRRDILALEAEGKAKRVRGGAIPIAPPAPPLQRRLDANAPISAAVIEAAVAAIGSARTILMDGGTTILAVAETLSATEGRLVITPSPWVAVACQGKGIDVFLLGGTLRAQGGIATGAFDAGAQPDVAADIAVLGVCGLDADFGLSSDDHAESQMKRAMSQAAARTIVVTDAAKVGQRACHQTLAPDEIDLVVSNATGPAAADLREAGILMADL